MTDDPHTPDPDDLDPVYCHRCCEYCTEPRKHVGCEWLCPACVEDVEVAARTPPRNWKRLIHHVTGLEFCDRDCGCGQNSRLWWFPFGDGVKPWVPDWMNGGDTHDIWRWLVRHGKVRPKREATLFYKDTFEEKT